MSISPLSITEWKLDLRVEVRPEFRDPLENGGYIEIKSMDHGVILE